MPYKTRVVYDHKIDWGYKRINADYPTREPVEVKLFDLKKFVEEKRENKINDMLNSFSGPKPPMPDMKERPLMQSKNPADKKDFNIDDLVKRIDAKIAELEEQERLEKEENKQPVSLEKPIASQQVKPMVEEKPVIPPQPKPIVEEKTAIPKTKDITDDQFFDDFFNDE